MTKESHCRTARCSCGALTCETVGEPDAVVACHCIDCQKRTGSVFGVGAYFNAERVNVSGAYSTYARPTESGSTMQQNFCPACGTNLFWSIDSRPGVMGIAVGGFADPGFPPPVRSVWEQSHHAWLGLPEGITRLPKGRKPS